MFNASRIPTGRCSLGDDCKAPPNAELRQRYKCMHCGVQLHQPPFGCSVYFGEEEDALITCLPDKAFINCPSRHCRPAAPTPSKTANTPTPSKTATAPTPSKTANAPTQSKTARSSLCLLKSKKQLLSDSTRHTTRILPPAKKQRRGRKKGEGAPLTITVGQWYHACKTYRDNTNNMSKAQFLRCNTSDDVFNGSVSQQQSFGRMLKKFDDGVLIDSKMKRIKKTLYPGVEKKLIDYLTIRGEQYKRDKCGVSWLLMQEKCLAWGKELGYENFTASSGWLQKVMNRHGFSRINLHGEANDMDDEERRLLMIPFRKKLVELCEDMNVTRDRVYNADQTGLCYQKLPNTLYVKKEKKRSYAGTKMMKDKNRVTIMVCTAGNGDKLPLAIIGKPKDPVCFRLLHDKNNTPIPYIHQVNAWFDKHVTAWWIKHVLLPEHHKRHGVVNAILILDNCSAHKIDMSLLPKHLVILFLPPNVTNTHQPADMGMIASLKMGYKSVYLRRLLDIFDAPGGFETAAEERRKQKRGCKGVSYGGKPHLLDCMEMLKRVWDGDKYVSNESISRCWRKADIFPLTWNADINNDVGSGASMSVTDKTMDDTLLSNMCDLMAQVSVKAAEVGINANDATVLRNSFALEKDATRDDFEEMIENWIDEESNPVFINEIIDDEIDAMENEGLLKTYDKAEYDDSEESEDELMCPQPMTIVENRVSHVEATKAVDVLRKYMTSLEMPQDCFMTLARLQRQIVQERVKKTVQQPSISSMFHKMTKR